MAGKSDYAKIRQRFAEHKRIQAEMEDNRWWNPMKPEVGSPPVTHRIRILPPPDGFDSWYLEYGVHYRLKAEDGTSITAICPLRTMKKPCPVCEFTKGLWRTGLESDQILAREIGSKTRYVSNLLVLSENPTEVKMWSYGIKVWTPLNELCVGDTGEVIPIDDPQKGFNIKIVISVERTAEGNFPNYTVMPEMKPTPIPDKSVLDKIHPMHEIIRGKVKSYDELRSILLGSGQAGSTDISTMAAQKSAAAVSEPEVASADEDKSDELVVPANEEKVDAKTPEKPVSQSTRPSSEELVRRARANLAKRQAQ